MLFFLLLRLEFVLRCIVANFQCCLLIFDQLEIVFWSINSLFFCYIERIRFIPTGSSFSSKLKKFCCDLCVPALIWESQLCSLSEWPSRALVAFLRLRASSLSKNPTTASSTSDKKMKPMQPNIQMSRAYKMVGYFRPNLLRPRIILFLTFI